MVSLRIGSVRELEWELVRLGWGLNRGRKSVETVVVIDIDVVASWK